MKRPLHLAAFVLWVTLLLSSGDSRHPATAPSTAGTSASMEGATMPEPPYARRRMTAARTERGLQGIEDAVVSATERARSVLSGKHLGRVLEVQAYVVGSARWGPQQDGAFAGSASRSATDTGCAPSGLHGPAAPQAIAPGCDPVPARDNYMNYYLMFTKGMMWFLGACGPGGGAGFLYAGPIGAGIGCAVVGLSTGFVAFSAEHERQEDTFKRAVRRWCNECKDEYWKNARFCANVLN